MDCRQGRRHLRQSARQRPHRLGRGHRRGRRQRRRPPRSLGDGYRAVGGGDVLARFSAQAAPTRPSRRQAASLRRSRGTEGGRSQGDERLLAALPRSLHAQRARPCRQERQARSLGLDCHRHCHVREFYLSTARRAHGPQTGKSMAWGAPLWRRTPPESAILGQRDNAPIGAVPCAGGDQWPNRPSFRYCMDSKTAPHFRILPDDPLAGLRRFSRCGSSARRCRETTPLARRARSPAPRGGTRRRFR